MNEDFSVWNVDSNNAVEWCATREQADEICDGWQAANPGLRFVVLDWRDLG